MKIKLTVKELLRHIIETSKAIEVDELVNIIDFKHNKYVIMQYSYKMGAYEVITTNDISILDKIINVKLVNNGNINLFENKYIHFVLTSVSTIEKHDISDNATKIKYN